MERRGVDFHDDHNFKGKWRLNVSLIETNEVEQLPTKTFHMPTVCISDVMVCPWEEDFDVVDDE